MKRPLLVACLLVGSAVVFAQAPQNPNYKPSGPAPTGPGDPERRGQTIQSGTLPPDTGGLTQAAIYKPLSDEWTSYSGDLTGKRHSALKLVTKENVKNLSLKWVTALPQGCGSTGTGPLTESDRYTEWEGAPPPETIFIFTDQGINSCVGTECGLEDFPQFPIRTFWTQESIEGNP